MYDFAQDIAELRFGWMILGGVLSEYKTILHGFGRVFTLHW